MSYAALWAKSNFSFLEGASRPEELIEQAHNLGLKALALTDRDGLYGAVRAHVKARELGFKLILGAQLSVERDASLVLLAHSRAGYANLCGLITTGRLRSPKGHCDVSWSEVQQHAGGLIALWDLGREAPLRPALERELEGRWCELRATFGDRLYGLWARRARAEEVQSELVLRARAARWGAPLVAANEVLYHRAERRRLQDVLCAIRHGVELSQAGRRLAPNAECGLRSPHAFATLFNGEAAALEHTREIASRCEFSLDQIRYRYPSERLPDGRSSSQWLRELAFAGAAERHGGRIPDATRAQLDKELALIDELDYGGYFLTMREIVQFCRSRSILCQGRGSAANSVVCYSLGVTAIDPVRMGLLFERFLSRERAEPPDIDLDIEHERREEVLQHVYEKYGRSHAAMVANVIRYRARSSVRDVGKALSLAPSMLARLTRQLSHGEGLTARLLREVGLDPQAPTAQALCELCDELEDFPRHLSIHPGGFLLGHEPVSTLVPIENATLAGRTVIQWDKDDVEALGLFKVDLLGLGALHHLHRCFDLLREHYGVDLSMDTIPSDDPATFDAICAADTVGVFQIESRAQMAMLPRLRPRHYYDLVIEVSIVRPGPITGGMVHPYLRRRRGEEPVEYPHESLRPVLEKTLGVPLFQEQVMKLAMVAADYTPGEADQLRRDMAAWRKSGRMGQHRERLVSRMTRKGISPQFAERVFQQICGFGEYGFPESHAASFALISYAGAWIKRHYPAAFACGLLNSQPMGFYTPATVLEDAVRHGVQVLPVDVLRSEWDCSLESTATDRHDPTPSHRLAIRMGLRSVKGLSAQHARQIVAARCQAALDSLQRLRMAAGLDRRTLSALARAGALEGLEPHRRQALWSALADAPPMDTLAFPQPQAPPRLEPLSDIETVDWDYRSKGHSNQGHPLSHLRQALTAMGLESASQVRERERNKVVRAAGLVICRQRPGTASGVLFLTLEDETGFVNVVVWPRVFEDHEREIKTSNFLAVEGKLQSEDSVTHLIAQRLWTPRLTYAPPVNPSRDFH